MSRFGLSKLIIAALLSVGFVLPLNNAQAVATWISPAQYSQYTIGQNVFYQWSRVSSYNYIRFGYSGSSWGSWINRGNATSYVLNTSSWGAGWLAAQVATYEGGSWRYSDARWIYLFSPPPPPPPPPPIPSAPTLGSSPSGTAYKGDTIVFSWNAPSGATHYYIAYRRDGTWDSYWTYNGGNTSASFNTTGLSSEIAAQVLACNSSGCSGGSNIAAVSLTPRPPGMQPGLTTLATNNSYTGTWIVGSDPHYFRIINPSGNNVIYISRLTDKTAVPALAIADGNGAIVTANVIVTANDAVVLMSPNQTLYLRVIGGNSGTYGFVFRRFSNLPPYEGL